MSGKMFNKKKVATILYSLAGHKSQAVPTADEKISIVKPDDGEVGQ